MKNEIVISKLSRAIGAERVLSAENLAAQDPVIAPENVNGLCAVVPGTIADISAVFEICAETGTPLIPQGGRTGLAGGAGRSGQKASIRFSSIATISAPMFWQMVS